VPETTLKPSPPDSLGQSQRPGRLLHNLLHQGVANFSGSLANLLLMPLVIKTAGAAVFGGYVVLNSLFTLTTQAFTLGAGYKCRRSLPTASTGTERAGLFVSSASFQLVTYAIAAVALMLAMPAIRHVFLHDQAPFALWLVPPLVFAGYLTYLSDDFYRYTQRLRFISFATAARSFGVPALVLTLGLVSGRLSMNRLFAAQTVAFIVPGLVLWLLIVREIPLRFKLSSWEYYRNDIRYGLPLATAVLVENFLATSDRYILAGCLSIKDVGAYSVACALGSLILLVPKVVSSVLPATLAQAMDTGRKAEAESLLNRALQGYMLLAVPFIGGCALLSPALLTIIGNPEVAAIARWVPPIIAVGSALYGYTWIVFASIFVQMNTRLWFHANVAAAITAVALNFALLALFHRVEAAAVAMTLSYALSMLIIERARSRSWRIHLDLRLLGKAFLATLVMMLVVWALGQSPVVRSVPSLAVTAQIAVGIVTYAIVLMQLSGLPYSSLKGMLGCWRKAR
jgi:O-antigen/teichoic acid export membrane protein